MALDLYEERWRFQNFFLLIHTQGSPSIRNHPQFAALGREFDSYGDEHKVAVAVELTECEKMLKTFTFEHQTFLEEVQKMNDFNLKGYPGGAEQQIDELLELGSYYNRFQGTAATLRQNLKNLVDIQRHYSVCSPFVLTTIAQIEEFISTYVSSVRSLGLEIKDKISSLQAAEPPNSAEQRREQRRERREQQAKVVEEGQIDYFEPLLAAKPGWMFLKNIGGGMGDASLWARADEMGVVQERVVRKDTRMHAESWNDARAWVFDVGAQQPKIPMEYYCHVRAFNQPSGSHIVRPRKFELDHTFMTVRLYTEFCPLGDLNNLIKENNKQLKKIPEAWVWHAFSGLVECGLAMESDCDASSDRRVPQQIVHQDLKPMNVFLDLAPAYSQIDYPQAKVGDFGLAVSTCPEDQQNPFRWGLSGTKGYHAPEQLDLERRPLPARVHQLLAHTNVWGIGRIMQDIVNQSPNGRTGPVYQITRKLDYTSSWREEVPQLYSGALLHIIARCIAFDPRDRPSFAELRNTIDHYVSTRIYALPNNVKRRQTYLADPSNGFQPEQDQQKLHGLPDKQYVEHMVFAKLNRPRVDASSSATSGAGVTMSTGVTSFS